MNYKRRKPRRTVRSTTFSERPLGNAQNRLKVGDRAAIVHAVADVARQMRPLDSLRDVDEPGVMLCFDDADDPVLNTMDEEIDTHAVPSPKRSPRRRAVSEPA